LSIISLDFEKAYDKIGIHTIEDELIRWRIGSKILRYVINFLSNRRINIKIKNVYSEGKPFHNGIPQGSLHNKLCRTIAIHKEFNFFSYADDFTIVRQISKRTMNANINALFTDILNWCSYSGAKLSISTCKHLHICRKPNCNFKINSTAYPLSSSDHKTKRYRWKKHIDSLTDQISKRLNIIKLLASRKYNCDIRTLISLTNALIMTKIDFCLPFYGNCPASYFKKLKANYHSALRLAFGAFLTTPINNLLFDAQLMPIELRFEMSIAKMCKALLFAANTPIQTFLQKIKQSNRTPRLQSRTTISYCCHRNDRKIGGKVI